MKPGFIDFVAAILAVCIAVPSLIVVDALFFRISDVFSGRTARPQQYPYNPYAPTFPYQPRPQPRPAAPKPPPPPPPAPYTSSDCTADVRLGSDDPHQSYIKNFCECFTPLRSSIGPKNLTEQQESSNWRKIEGEIMPECERQGLSSFINDQSLTEKFSPKFRNYCLNNPVIFFGERSKLNKNDQLCQCLTSGLMSDKATMAASVAGAGRIAGRPSVLSQINICVREAFPPSMSSGWQISKKPDGKIFANVNSKDHQYISSIEFSCSDSGKLALTIAWRKKPIKDQLFFYGGEDDPDTIIPLKNGYAEGKNAKKLYDLIVNWQKLMKDGNQDLDLTGFTFQATGSEVGDKQEIILGDTQKRLGELVKTCKPVKNQPDSGATAVPKNLETNKAPTSIRPDKLTKCLAEGKRFNSDYKFANSQMPKGMYAISNKICELQNNEIRALNNILSNMKECRDVINYADLIPDTSEVIRLKKEKYTSECRN